MRKLLFGILAGLLVVNFTNAANHLGANDWRLPTAEPLDGISFNYSFSWVGGTDWGYNQSAPGTAFAGSMGNEMAYFFYNTLSNEGACDPLLSSWETGCYSQGGFGLSNVGPFSNLQPGSYWFGTEVAPATQYAWFFEFSGGTYYDVKDSALFYAWAVRSGDIGDVPFDDADSDGVADAIDSCTNVSNALAQCDSDADGYGNACDGDMNNNATTNSQDYVLFRRLLGSPPGPSGLVP